MMRFSETEILGAMEGVAYIVSEEGALLAFGSSNGASIIHETNMARPENVAGLIGSNIYDIIQGDEVRAWYRKVMTRILSGSEREVTFNYRCDAPDIRREMRMCMSGIRRGGHTRAVLYHSVILSESSRPPLPLLDPKAILEHGKRDKRPIVAMCSICARVKMDRVCANTWVNAEYYYRLGGKADVRISHGICPGCFAKAEGPQAALLSSAAIPEQA